MPRALYVRPAEDPSGCTRGRRALDARFWRRTVQLVAALGLLFTGMGLCAMSARPASGCYGLAARR